MAKTTYTYEDFVGKAKASGLLGSFSDADLRLAQSNPDAGISLLSYKEDYNNAKTDESRALANAGAEKIRSIYGGYTAGSSGSGYYLNEENTNTTSYVNQYEDKQQTLLDALSGSFSYDSDTDEAWRSYRKAYLREGQRAYEDSLGAAAANTGGIASTAAVTAAQQARNYYDAQASDKLVQLYQQAYDNYLAARGEAASELSVYDQMNQTAAANRQQVYDNAVEKWKSYGYVTQDVADILGLPTGTAYTEQAYNAWYQAFQEAANGIYTGKTLADTVNPSAQEEDGDNPAQGDNPQNHGKVSQGSSGADVSTMQQYLIALGYHCGDAGADGVFGSATRAAVRAFQADYGLSVDGVCGQKTWYALIAALN